jgi:hypothetical protein
MTSDPLLRMLGDYVREFSGCAYEEFRNEAEPGPSRWLPGRLDGRVDISERKKP